MEKGERERECERQKQQRRVAGAEIIKKEEIGRGKEPITNNLMVDKNIYILFLRNKPTKKIDKTVRKLKTKPHKNTYTH